MASQSDSHSKDMVRHTLTVAGIEMVLVEGIIAKGQADIHMAMESAVIKVDKEEVAFIMEDPSNRSQVVMGILVSLVAGDIIEVDSLMVGREEATVVDRLASALK